MLGIAAWSIVVASLLLIGVFGYASIGREPQNIALALGRSLIMIIGAAVSAIYLNEVANQIFTRIEINAFKRFGSIQEDQMQPDMPNLMAGLVMFGWAFFVAGVLVARWSKGRTKIDKSEQADAGKPDPAAS
jgi:hypothetical protein